MNQMMQMGGQNPAMGMMDPAMMGSGMMPQPPGIPPQQAAMTNQVDPLISLILALLMNQGQGQPMDPMGGLGGMVGGAVDAFSAPMSP